MIVNVVFFEDSASVVIEIDPNLQTQECYNNSSIRSQQLSCEKRSE